MKIVFVSNFLNHHQTPVAEELYRRLGDGYHFISTTETPDSFLKSGYPDCRNKPYNILAYRDKGTQDEARRIVDEADVVVIGSAPYSWVEKRVEAGKQVFIYSERWFKKVPKNYFSPGLWKSIFKYHFKWSKKKNVSVLCSSAFLPRDLDLLHLYEGRRYKWGYFPECSELDIENIIAQRNKDVVDIFWCARFIDWKRWDLPILLARHLKDVGYKFYLRVAGGGEDWEKATRLVGSQGVEDCVSLIGNFPNREILEKMRNSSIFLFTSTREEGWGAVLNEAMGAGCAVVSGDQIGAAPYLVRDGENGLLFKSCDFEDFVRKVKMLLGDSNLRVSLSKSAYETMQNLWSPSCAAARLVRLCESIIKGESPSSLFTEGPCSIALRQ